MQFIKAAHKANIVKFVLMLAFVFGLPLVVTLASAKDIIVENEDDPGVCEVELKQCRDDLAVCQSSTSALRTQIKEKCGMDIDPSGTKLIPIASASAKPTTTAKPTSTATSKPTTTTTATTVPSTTATVTKPVEHWVGKGFSVFLLPGHDATKASDWNCSDLRYAPVRDRSELVVWCVFSSEAPDFNALMKRLSALEAWKKQVESGAKPEPTPGKDWSKEIADLNAEIEKLKNKSPDTVQIVGADKRVEGILKGLCDITDPDNAKWQDPEAVALKCRENLDERIEMGLVKHGSHAELSTGIAVDGGPAGFQASAELGVTYLYGFGRTKFLSGANFGWTFESAKTGQQVYIAPKVGIGVYAGDPLLRSTVRWDFYVMAIQRFTVAGNDPTIGGVKYNAGVLWGTYGAFGMDVNFQLSSWLHLVVGGHVGYGSRINTVPETKAGQKQGLLTENAGFGGGGHAGLSFVF